jgi:hypothetical protein
MHKVPALTGCGPVSLRVAGRNVRISARTSMHGVEPRRKTVTVRLG